MGWRQFHYGKTPGYCFKSDNVCALDRFSKAKTRKIGGTEYTPNTKQNFAAYTLISWWKILEQLISLPFGLPMATGGRMNLKMRRTA
ncbi:hypothetical protein ESCO_002730 [Escovopsis weberi]|uniref:Uncharacterized protein n=1 Tax=Escovopsis weberi TaxID=150374 RepID=A0A0M8N1Q4_ESCWE|nr:hypothetical protein ESCO_002730 [Escovopsis weberi]